MKKNTILMLLLYVSFSAFAQFPAPYCGPITFTSNVEPITLVNFAGINNTSTEVTGGTAHENYTAISGAVTAGQSYMITLKGNTDGNFINRFVVFIDWNQDGDFEDTGETYQISETITNSSGTDAVQATQSLSIPTSALGGTTRMRVKKIFGTADYANPCMGTGYGQVEDYSLVVTPSNACAGAPAPGNTISSVATVCSGISFTLSLQNAISTSGITFQWQTSTDGTNYTNATGVATNETYTANQTVATYYQCLVTCATSSTTTISTPVQVGMTTPSNCYCTPVYTTGKTDGDLISNIVIVGTTLSNNSGTEPLNPAFTYFTGQANYTATLQAGSNYNVTVSVGTFGGQHVAVWIDYNDDGIFSISERVGYTTAPIAANGSATFQIALACNPVLGMHRMRVRNVWNVTGVNIDPCSSYGYGETEDYNVTISTAAACPQPSALGVSGITAASAILSWTLGCVETNWDVHVTNTGGGTPTGAPSNPNVSSPLTVSGLAPSTVYDFYVRANCLGNGFSVWSGPFSFTTAATPPVNDECTTAIELTVGGTYSQNLINTTNVGATTSSPAAPTVCFGYNGGDIWFRTIVPASGSLTLETGDATTGGTGVDTVITAYTGDCNALTQIGCDDDGADTGAYSKLSLVGLIPGSTVIIRVYEYSNDNFGSFAVSAYDASLSTTIFNTSNFNSYPNPVKDVLNITYNQNISKVAVFNILGQELVSKSINASHGQIDISNLVKGTYLVKVTADNQIKTLKIIKE